MKDKITYLNTLKFLACFAVFNCHFLNFGYTILGLNDILQLRLFDSLKSGSLAVVMFIMIACLLMAMKILKEPTVENIKNTMIKRYFRLIIPIAIVNVMIFVLYKCQCFQVAKEVGMQIGNSTLQGAYQYDLSIASLFSDTLIDIAWKGEAGFNYPLWMIKDLFVGMFCTILLCLAIYKNKNKYILLGMILIASCWNISFIFVYVLAVILACLLKDGVKQTNICGYILFVAGCVILIVYKDLIGMFDGKIDKLSFIHSPTFYEAIACFCIIIGIANAKIVNKIFSCKIFDKLNNLSFGIYLLHWPLFCSVSSWIYIKLIDDYSKKTVCSITYIISLVIVMILSFIYYKVEKMLAVKINKISAIFAGYNAEK